MKTALFVLGVGAASTLGCDPFASTARGRIGRELACSEERTMLRPLARDAEDAKDRRRYRAHGCGRAATYVCNRDDECWRVGEVEDDPTGPPPGVALE